MKKALDPKVEGTAINEAVATRFVDVGSLVRASREKSGTLAK